MSYSPIAIKRSVVLGNLYGKCETINSVPVHLNDKSGELLGYADESMGRYADTFLFHLPEDICKKLSTGHFNFSFDVTHSDIEPNKKKQIVLNYIFLTGKNIRSK